ncbi:hypothetical protein V8E52_002821 [Russula decolorans]
MVKAVIDDTVVAESSETVLIEGNHYFPPEAIKVDLSVSDTTYTCPYKGYLLSLFFYGTVTHDPSRHASYYSAKVNGTPVKDIAWVYPNPTSKFEIKGRYAFDQAQVQVISDPKTGAGNKL